MRLAIGPWTSANSLRKSSMNVSCSRPLSFAGCSPRSLKHSSSVARTLPETNARASKASLIWILSQLPNLLVDLLGFFGALSYISEDHYKKLFRCLYWHTLSPCAKGFRTVRDLTLEGCDAQAGRSDSGSSEYCSLAKPHSISPRVSASANKVNLSQRQLG